MPAGLSDGAHPPSPNLPLIAADAGQLSFPSRLNSAVPPVLPSAAALSTDDLQIADFPEYLPFPPAFAAACASLDHNDQKTA